MEITEVRVKLTENRSEKLQAFCTLTIDHAFVIRDLKIIGGQRQPFVAMPSRKLCDKCPHCHSKNHLRAKFCNECGWRLNPTRAIRDDRGRAKLHTDIAHPINAATREQMELKILQEFQQEMLLSKQPGWQPRDLGYDYEDDYSEEAPAPIPRREEPRRGETDRTAEAF